MALPSLPKAAIQHACSLVPLQRLKCLSTNDEAAAAGTALRVPFKPCFACRRKQYGKVQDEDEDLEVQGGPATIQLPESSPGSLGPTSREAVDDYSYRSSGFVK